MTAPTFKTIGATAFREDGSFTTAHQKRTAENVQFCGNERRPLVTHAFAQRADGSNSARILPRLYAAQWVAWGPWQVYIPPITEINQRRQVQRVLITCTVENADVRLACVSGAPAISDGTVTGVVNALDSLTAAAPGSETFYTRLSPGDTLATMTILGAHSGWNDVWILLKTEFGALVGSQTAVGDSMNYGEFTVGTPVGYTKAVPEWHAVSRGVHQWPADTAQVYTVASVTSTGASVATMYLAEHLIAEQPDGWSDTATETVQIFDAGVLQVEGVAFELSQTVTVQDANYWPALRWHNFPSSSQGRGLASSIQNAHPARFPQPVVAMEQRYSVTNDLQQRGGLWRIGTATDWPSATEVARYGFHVGQKSYPTSAQSLVVRVPVFVAARSIRTSLANVTISADVLDSAGGATGVTGSSLAQVPVQNGNIYTDGTLTARWAFLAYATENTGGVAETTGTPLWSHEGLTALGEVTTCWTTIEVPMDISALAVGQYLVRVAVTFDLDFGGFCVIGNPAVKVFDNGGA